MSALRILINAAVVKRGGGVQVVDSVCRELYKFRLCKFTVVLHPGLYGDLEEELKLNNIDVYNYNFGRNIYTYFTGRNKFLDDLVDKLRIDCVITVFGPSIWLPKCSHLSGFARAQILFKDSPYIPTMTCLQRFLYIIRRKFDTFFFNRCDDTYYTENMYITSMLKNMFPSKDVYTITNYYNQIFDYPSKWDKSLLLPEFKGFTSLTISANYDHKNLKIIIPTIKYLLCKYKKSNFRFVLTINREDFPSDLDGTEKYIIFLGPVKIQQCPFLYEQSNIMLLPSLMECFSASYPESMKMSRPIITTDLEFAHALCGDAALYYDPLSPNSLGETFMHLMADDSLYKDLVSKGQIQLAKYDNYQKRVQKLITIASHVYEKYSNI